MEVKKESSGSQILWGLLCIGSAGFLYYELTRLETSGGTMSLNIIFAMLYNLFGKNVASGILAALGLFITIGGILDFKNKKKVKAIDEEEYKPEFISLNDEQFEIIRKLSDEEIDYFETLYPEIRHSQIYEQYWTDFLEYENENDENWLNISRYFWKANEPFYNTLLPESFKHYQRQKFTFLNNASNGKLKIQKVSGIVEKFHFEEENRVVSISELLERDLIAYCKIVDLAQESIDDIKQYQSEFFFVITNPKISSYNNELYIGENKISIEIAYAIDGIELARTLSSDKAKEKYETNILLNEPEIQNNSLLSSEFGINKTRTTKTATFGDNVITTEIVTRDSSSYVPNVKNKQLYFETLILLMTFIQECDKSVDITRNKFYILAVENCGKTEEFTEAELYNKIFENAEKCKIEFTDAELGYLVKNSVNVLKGKFAIQSDISTLYYKLFDVFKFLTTSHETYFYSLLR